MFNGQPETAWVQRNEKRNHACMRLFCFPHAGAGGVVFKAWIDSFPPTLDVCAIELPGKMTRRRDPSANSMRELVETLDAALTPYLDLPFAVFGYSLGALTAFEWCKIVRRRHQREPESIMVAASAAPHLAPGIEPISHLPQAEFLRVVERRYGALDAVLRAEPELLALISDVLRRDLKILESYRCEPDRPFACPIVAMGGTKDPRASGELLSAWQHHTTEPVKVAMFEGEHLFLRTRPAELAATVKQHADEAVERLLARKGSILQTW